MRKRYSAKFKAEIVQEVLWEEKTITEDEIYPASPFYGSRRIAEELRQHRHMPVARETVQRCMTRFTRICCVT